MSNYKQTMCNGRSFVLNHPMVADGYENFDCSNCSGFELTLKNGYSVKIRVDKTIDYVIFEMYPGILVRGAFLPMVAEYCQHATRFPAVSFLTVDVDQGSVYLHSEQSFRDAPVSEAHFGRMLEDAVRQLEPHVPVLQSLAYGRLPNLKELCSLEEAAEQEQIWVHTPQEQEMLDRSLEAIGAYLQDSGHNVVGRNVDPTSDMVFFSETMTRDSRYKTYYYIRGGYLVQAVRLDIRVAEALRTQAAQAANTASDEKKVGYLTVAAPDGYAYVMMSQYLLDGEEPITSDNLDHMENIAISFLHFSEKFLRSVAQGVRAPEEKEAPKAGDGGSRTHKPAAPGSDPLEELLRHMMAGKEDDDDGEDEDEKSGGDMLDLLSGLDLD